MPYLSWDTPFKVIINSNPIGTGTYLYIFDKKVPRVPVPTVYDLKKSQPYLNMQEFKTDQYQKINKKPSCSRDPSCRLYPCLEITLVTPGLVKNKDQMSVKSCILHSTFECSVRFLGTGTIPTEQCQHRNKVGTGTVPTVPTGT